MQRNSVLRPEMIERLAMAVYPSFAMLAGMELDVFTSLNDGPLTGDQVATALSIDPTRLKPLLYAPHQPRPARDEGMAKRPAKKPHRRSHH